MLLLMGSKKGEIVRSRYVEYDEVFGHGVRICCLST
jgi:hypothetical protein